VIVAKLRDYSQAPVVKMTCELRWALWRAISRTDNTGLEAK